MSQTAILGAGVMGETLLSGLVRAGRRVDDLLVGEKRPERARELEERYGGAALSDTESRVPEVCAVVRVMPNTPALVDQGMAAIAPGSHCDEAHLAEVKSLM